MGERVQKGFVFSFIAIAISSILLGFALFLFNSNENYNALNLKEIEIKKINFVSENLFTNISKFFDINVSFEKNVSKIELNINNDKNFFSLKSLENFYNNVLEKLNGGDLNIDLNNLADGKLELFFDNQTFEFDYNNKIVKLIPISDSNYIINIKVNNYRSSYSLWNHSSSGVYVILNYSDFNGSFSDSGYIDGTNLCSINSFVVNYNYDTLRINVCKDNAINNVLVIAGNFSNNYTTNISLTFFSKTDVKSMYYNADLNYFLGDSKFIGKVFGN